MILRYHYRRMQELLRSFHTLTQMRIVVLDASFEKVAEYPGEDCAFCSFIRSAPDGAQACRTSDEHACRQCETLGRFYAYTCHAGLMEAVAPIHCGNILMGYIMLGQVRVKGEDAPAWAEVQRRCGSYELNDDALREAYFAQGSFTMAQILASAQLLEACAGYLYLQRLISIQEDSASQRLDAYLSAHLQDELSVQRLCQAFNVSRSKLYSLSLKTYGTSIVRAVRRLRINAAKELLATSNRSLGEIAALVGYNDYNYFIKVFRSETGMTPTRYCQSLQPFPALERSSKVL